MSDVAQESHARRPFLLKLAIFIIIAVVANQLTTQYGEFAAEMIGISVLDLKAIITSLYLTSVTWSGLKLIRQELYSTKHKDHISFFISLFMMQILLFVLVPVTLYFSYRHRQSEFSAINVVSLVLQIVAFVELNRSLFSLTAWLMVNTKYRFVFCLFYYSIVCRILNYMRLDVEEREGVAVYE